MVHQLNKSSLSGQVGPSLRQILIDEHLMLSTNPYGTDKGDYKSYVDKFYEKAFEPLQSNEIMLLEIGFRHGASLALWSSYFQHGLVFGIDDNSDPVLRSNPAVAEWLSRANVRVTIGDAYSRKVAENINTSFDIIIDDGPHTLSSQKLALDLYLPKLKNNGYFVIEDIQSIGRLAFFKFVKSIPSNFTIAVFDFRSERKGQDDVLFVVRRLGRKQPLRRAFDYAKAILGVGFEIRIRLEWLLQSLRKKSSRKIQDCGN